MKPDKEVTNRVWEAVESTLQSHGGTFQDGNGQQDQMVTGAHWREDPEYGAFRKKETLDNAKHDEAFGNHVVMLMPEKQQEIRKAIRDTRQNKMKQNYKERKCSHDAFLCFAEDVFIVS